MSTVAGEPVSAHDVAREIRRRMPGVPKVKLHKLLYYSQGHHLGTFGVPLFSETIAAWDMGPVVGQLWYRERSGIDTGPGRELTEAQLNTIGYVLSRYGKLTGKDLETLSHNQAPWLQANERRMPKYSAKIEQDAIREFFASDVEEDEVPLDSDAVRAWLAGTTEPLPDDPGEPDDMGRLAARREELLARTRRG